jgi:hypothetical protein
VIRAVAAGMALAALAGAVRSCEQPSTSEGGGGRPMAKQVSHPVTFMASWKSGFWVDINIIIGDDAKGPFERQNGSYSRTIDVPPETRVEIKVTPHEDPPPGPTVCAVKWFTNFLPPNGYEHRQDGKCHAWGYVPKVETQG